MEQKLKDTLVCPICKGSLERKKHSLFCPSCKKAYPFVEEIADFRISSVGVFARFRIHCLQLKMFFATHSWKEIFAFIFHARNSPHQIAMGAALGVFLSVIPSFVLGGIFALFIAWRRKYHLPATYFGTLLVNPFNGPFVYFMNYKVGVFFLGGEERVFPLSFSSLSDIGLALYFGGFLVALVSALLVYGLVYAAVYGYRKMRRKE